jgi:nucleotide-binding universal stress UspA family protein
MYKHILIATDGSEIANKAMAHGIELAKEIGAKLSAVTVTEPYESVVVVETMAMILPGDYNKASARVNTGHAVVILTGPISRAPVLSISDEQSFLSSSPLPH